MDFPISQGQQRYYPSGSSRNLQIPSRNLFPRHSVQYEHSPLFPLSPSISGIPRANSVSANLRNTHTALEKGLDLANKLFGYVPPLPERDKHKARHTAIKLTSDLKEGKATYRKPTLGCTFLDLQEFEVHSRLRRRATMSSSSATSVIKLTITPASPCSKLRRVCTDSEELAGFSHSPKARLGQLPHFPVPTDDRD